MLSAHHGRLRETPARFKLFPMDASLTDLAAALRERLAIIGDEESRREPERHTKRLHDRAP